MLISKYEKLLRTIIRNKVGNPDTADDVFSETCLAVVRRFRRKGTADIKNADLEEMGSIYKDVIELWLEGWTFVEIGAKLGISENTAKSRKRIFVDRLRKHFGVSPPNKKPK